MYNYNSAKLNKFYENTKNIDKMSIWFLKKKCNFAEHLNYGVDMIISW